MVDRYSSYEYDINQATGSILEIFPTAELTSVTQAVTCAASLSGESAYNILVEQAVAIYLESVDFDKDTKTCPQQPQSLASSSSQFPPDARQASQVDENTCTPSESFASTVALGGSNSTTDTIFPHADISDSSSTASLHPRAQLSSSDEDEFGIEPSSSTSTIDTNAYSKGPRVNVIPNFPDPNFLSRKVTNSSAAYQAFPTTSRGASQSDSSSEDDSMDTVKKQKNFSTSFWSPTFSDMYALSRQVSHSSALHQAFPTASQSDSSSEDDSMDSLQNLTLNINSSRKSKNSLGVQEKMAPQRNPSSVSSTSSAHSERDESMETVSKTSGLKARKRSHAETESESPPYVPCKKANLGKVSLVKANNKRPSKCSLVRRKKAKAGLNQWKTSGKKFDIIDLTDDTDVRNNADIIDLTDGMDATGSAGSLPKVDKKQGAGKLQQEIMYWLNHPGPFATENITLADANSDLKDTFYQMELNDNSTPKPEMSSTSTALPHKLLAIPPGYTAVLLKNPGTRPDSFEGEANEMQGCSSEEVNQQFNSPFGDIFVLDELNTAEFLGQTGTCPKQMASMPGTLQQFILNSAQTLNSEGHEVNAQSPVSHGSVQSQTGSHLMKISSCESVGISEPSSSIVGNLESTDQVGENSPPSQGLLEPSSTGSENQESKPNNLPLPNASVPGNYFGTDHLKSVVSYCCDKLSSAQSLKAIKCTMSNLFVMPGCSQLPSGWAQSSQTVMPVLLPSTSNIRGLQGGISSHVEKNEGDVTSGYGNYRVFNNETDGGTRFMLKSSDDANSEGGTFSTDSDILECSVCSTSNPVHKCVSCYAGHFLCKSCVEEEIQSVMLSKDKMDLLCTANSCQEVLCLASLEHLIDPFLIGLLRKKMHQKEVKITSNAIKKMEGLVSCPSCNYSGLMESDEYQFVCGNNNCTERCCRYCKSQWTCKEEHFACFLLSYVGTECFNDITVLPLNWEEIDGEFQVKIDPSSLEGLGWNEYFQKTSPKRKIVALWRVQNKKLWERYVVKRKHMAEELGIKNIQEKALYHGTKSENVDKICNEGFDFRVDAANGRKLGKGIYFSNSAVYSQTFVCNKNLMFIARVLCGRFTSGHQSLSRPPLDLNGRLYDCCVDNVLSPTMFTVFDNAQCYPEILVKFK